MTLLQKLEVLIDLMIAHYGGAVTAAAAEPKATRTRKPKDDAAIPPTPPAPAPTPAAPAQPAAPEMTDKESYDELCRLAIAYIAADKPGTEQRRAFAMKHVEDTYKADALSKVPHGPNRIQLTAWFKEQLAKPAAAAPAPSGFGV